eukprot:gene12759-biopygen16958
MDPVDLVNIGGEGLPPVQPVQSSPERGADGLAVRNPKLSGTNRQITEWPGVARSGRESGWSRVAWGSPEWPGVVQSNPGQPRVAWSRPE